MFNHPSHSGNASSQLLCLCQSNHFAVHYSVEFWNLNADAGWNNAALQGVFVKGLNENLNDELAAQDEPSGLSDLVSSSWITGSVKGARNEPLAIPVRHSNHISHVAISDRCCCSIKPYRSSPAQPVEDESMQLGLAKSSLDECPRRIPASECLYYDKTGHFV